MYQSSLLDGVKGILHGFGTAGVPVENYVGDARIFRTHQVHGNAVHVLDDESVDGILNGDAFITSKPGVVCYVRTADCVPILVVDPVKRLVGAVHAGWRGTEANIVGAAITKMRERFGCDPTNMLAAIGPAICKNCYDTDLLAANHAQLVCAGMPDTNIDVIALCTSCGDADLASYRRDRTDVRQVSYILYSAGCW